MTTLAWFHCFAGIAGDMAMASLVDAGADLDAVSALIKRVPVSGWSIEAEPVLRAGVAATRLHVHAEDTPVAPRSAYGRCRRHWAPRFSVSTCAMTSTRASSRKFATPGTKTSSLCCAVKI